MQKIRVILFRYRGALIYTAICLAIILIFNKRTWQHVATLNGDGWEPIQAVVTGLRVGDEPICFLPSWTSGHATDLYKFRDIDVLGSPDEAWERQSPLPGFFVVSQFGSFDESDVPSDLYPHRGHIPIGGAEVYLFRQSAFTMPENLALRIQEARCVLHGPERKRIEFPWKRTGYVFPPNSLGRDKQWNYLGCRIEQDRFGGRNHYGIWFHPPPRGYSLSLTWPELALKKWLVVSGGIRDRVAKRRGSTVKMSATVNGKKLATLSFPSKRGWTTFAIDTGIAQGRKATGKVSFKVWAKKNHSRHFVFNGILEDTRPEEALDPGEASKGRSSSRDRASARKNSDQAPAEEAEQPEETEGARQNNQNKSNASRETDIESPNHKLSITRGDHEKNRRGKLPLRTKTPGPTAGHSTDSTETAETQVEER